MCIRDRFLVLLLDGYSYASCKVAGTVMVKEEKAPEVGSELIELYQGVLPVYAKDWFTKWRANGT